MSERPKRIGGAIPLRPRQKSLSPVSPTDRLGELLKRKDAKHLVRSMPVPDLYSFVKQLGFDEAGPLLAQASGDQIQRMTDLEIWRRDEVDLQRLTEWLEGVIAADSDQLAARARALDPEVMQVLIRSVTTIYTQDGDDAPAPEVDLEERELVGTPDDVFLLDFDGDGATVDFVRRMLDLLYRQDAELARGILFESMGTLPSTAQEEAYRVRTGRMEEMGFADLYEALVIYQALPRNLPPPARRMASSGSSLQTVPLVPELARPRHDSFFAQALKRVQEDFPREDLHHDLVHLANKVLSAESLDPGEETNARVALQIVHDHVSIGLELMSAGDVDHAARILVEVHTEHIFREAQTRLLRLRQGAERELARATAGLVLPRRARLTPDAPHDGVFQALRGLRPRFDASLAGEAGVRGFRSLAEVDLTARAAAQAVQVARFVAGHIALEAVPPEVLAPALQDGRPVTPGRLLLTALAQRILGARLAPRPLSSEEARRFITAARAPEGGGLRPELLAELERLAITFGGNEGPATIAALEAFLSGLDGAFRKSYGALEATRPTRGPIGGPLLVLPPPAAKV